MDVCASRYGIILAWYQTTVEFQNDILPTPAAWDEFVAAQPAGHLLQTRGLGRAQAPLRLVVRRVAVRDAQGDVAVAPSSCYAAWPG